MIHNPYERESPLESISIVLLIILCAVLCFCL